MSRQRLRPSLGDATQLTCPRCKGQGSIRNIESVALSVLRILEEVAMKKGTEKVITHLPIECATFLLNEKRTVLQDMEARHKVGIIVLPSKHLETPAYDIERIKSDEDEEKPSHLQIKAENITIPEFAQKSTHVAEKPAIKEFLPDAPAPAHNKKASANLIQRFWQKLVGTSESNESASTRKKSSPEKNKKPEEKPRNSKNPRNARNRNNSDRRSNQNRSRRNNTNRNTQRNTDSDKNQSNSNIKTENKADSSEQNKPSSSQAKNTTRGSGRRRTRNPSNRKPENNRIDSAQNKTNEQAKDQPKNNEKPRSYANKFAEQKKLSSGSEESPSTKEPKEPESVTKPSTKSES